MTDPLDFSPPLLRIQEKPPQPLAGWMLRLLVALLAGVVLWAALGRLDIVAVAEGKLVPSSYLKIVQPAEQGIVKEILVKEGEAVQAGQVLVRMDPVATDADVKAIRAEYLNKRIALRRIDAMLGARAVTVFSNRDNIESNVLSADLVIGAVLIPGAAAPKLVSRELVGRMKPGAVIVDVAIDQGGCCETSRPTTHAEPTYMVGSVVHYCVANMPGAVPRTSTYALNNATLPFVLALAEKGWRAALAADPHLKNGLNVCRGKVTHRGVAEALGLAYAEPDACLKA